MSETKTELNESLEEHALKQLEKKLDEEYYACVRTNNTYLFTVGAVVLAIPVCIKQKSYMPLMMLGFVGSGMDIYYPIQQCQEQRKKLDQVHVQIRRQELEAEKQKLEQQLKSKE